MTKKKQAAPLLNIGASPAAITAARVSILDILNVMHVDHATRIAALQAFTAVCQVQNVSITGCNFQGGA